MLEGINGGGERLLCTRPYVILPYSEIAWIYYEYTRAEDSDEVVGLNIRCRNGKRFQIEGDDARRNGGGNPVVFV